MKDKIEKQLALIISKLNLTCHQPIVIEVPASSQNGDYASNIALKIANQNNQSPMELATLLKTNFDLAEASRVEVKSPGFLNFFVQKDYLFENIFKVLKENSDYGKNNIGNGKKINLEFVSANPTGIIHLGNARGGAYGDNLARILKFSGYEVNKEYYINDSGNQINNLGLSLKCRYLENCGIKEEMPENGYFGEDIIKLANLLFEENGHDLVAKEPIFFSDYAVKSLLAKIIDDLKSYRILYDTFTSEKDIKKTNYIEEVLEKFKTNDYIYENEGATWFKGTLFGSPRDFVLIKKDGNYTYVLPDIAHHLDTLSKGYNKLINVLGADHHGYVPVLKSTLKALGYDTDKIDIKLLQLVRLVKNGQEYKMSKRAGTAVTLTDLIDEVGVNAARYFFASRSLDSQMDFDLELAKKESSENPVYYISYAYARICSILKDQKLPEVNIKYTSNLVNNPDVCKLLEKVYNFPEVVILATSKELPHLIANYCYELANLFHIYYSKYRIITDNEVETAEGLNIIMAVKITLFNALNLIGVIPPEKM